MKNTRIKASVIALLLCAATLLPGCAEITEQVTTPAETEDLFPEDTAETTEELKPEDIVYPEGELPTVYITTDDGKQVTSKNVYSHCNIRMEMNGVYAEYQSTYTDENGGGAQIRCRGNMTYNIPDVKKHQMYSYKLKLDTKADLFGMGESKHWYLVNCWRDVSYLRHKLAYDLSASLGLYATDSTWVSVYYNGEYRGLYLMTESIQIANDRLEMTNWEEFAEEVGEKYAEDNQLDEKDTEVLLEAMEHNLSWMNSGKVVANLPSGKHTADVSPYFDPDKLDLTTGYLIEICNGMDTEGAKWKTNAGFFIVLDSPMFLHTNGKMFSYVRDLIQDFEDAVMSPTFHNSKGKHYSEYVDVDSMVDYWMVWNFFVNTEFGARSMYFYIQDGKMIFGPCWDFDGTSGNIMSTTKSGGAYDKWLPDRSKTWFKEVFGDPWFTAKCQERWYTLSPLLEDYIDSMDIYARYIKAEAERCYERTGPRYEIVRQPDVNNGHSFTPWEDYVYTRKWFVNRIKWLDEHFAKIDPNIDGGGYERSAKIFAELTANGAKLENDNTSVYGLACDYVIPCNQTGRLELNLTTTHSGVTSVEAYLNGTENLGKIPLSATVNAQYLIDVFTLDLSHGAVNTVYLIARRADGSIRSMSSVVIRVSEMGNPNEDESIVQLGNETVYVKTGSTFKLPEPENVPEGFIFVGWAKKNGKVYPAGEEINVKENVYLYEKWQRTDIFSRMDFFPDN